ncbi:hypothetical protein F4859DRAFT_520475 [Xylaria cf. heliscus]|nr:hypothetical protein F4859DRAFT_520475 [Xylaria cf. heliscus]
MLPSKRRLSDACVSSDQTSKKRTDLKKRDDVADTITYESDIESDLERQLAKTKDDIDGIKNAFAKIDNSIGQLMRQKRGLEDKLKLAQKQGAQLAEDLEQIAGVQHSAPDLDNVLESQFMDLKEQIRSFTFNFCDRQILPKSTPEGLPDHVKGALATISGISTARILKSGLHARYFIQALIWRFLCDGILTSPFSIWGENSEIGEFVTKIQNSPKLPLNRRQLWRTMTGRILVDMAHPRRFRIENWRNKLVWYIEPLVATEHKDDIAKHVEPILDKAIDLAKNLAQSRTTCVIQRKGVGDDDRTSQKYDDSWMEVVEKTLVYCEDIDFLVTPALIQLTNSIGEAFKNPRVIVKAEVCFGRGRLSVFAPPASCLPPNKNQATQTLSSERQGQGARRLGNLANNEELNEVIGDNVDQVKDSSSEEYKEEAN